jgi:hypothetical protein
LRVFSFVELPLGVEIGLWLENFRGNEKPRRD